MTDRSTDALPDYEEAMDMASSSEVAEQETIAALTEALLEIRRGEGEPAETVMARLRRRLGIRHARPESTE